MVSLSFEFFPIRRRIKEEKKNVRHHTPPSQSVNGTQTNGVRLLCTGN